MPVHLTGRMSNMILISKIANNYQIPLIEDAAQSIGSKFKNRHAGYYSKNSLLFSSSVKKFKCFWR